MSMKSLKLLCLLGLAVVLLGNQTGCGKQSVMGSSSMMGGAMPKTEVVVDTVKTEDVQLYMYVPGKTSPYKEVEIRARISGYLEQLLFVSGGIVKEGDKLAVIEQDQYQVALDAAKAELEVSLARAQLAKANLDRARQLVQTKTVSEEEFQSKQAEYDMAVATVELGKASVRKAELDLGYTNIIAPIPGKTTKNLVDVGNYISPGTESAKLLRIAQMDPIYIDFEISDRQLADIKDRMGFRDSFDKAILQRDTSVRTAAYIPENRTNEANVNENADNKKAVNMDLSENRLGVNHGRIDVSLTTGAEVLSADFPLTGFVVALIDNKITTETGQVTLRGEVRNPLLSVDGNEDYLLYPGQICRVRIPYENVKNAVLVHEEAIMTDLDTKYVLVVKKEMYQPKTPFGQPMKNPMTGEEIPATEEYVVHRRDVKIGRLLDTQQRIILSGLAKDEMYIAKGVQRARIGIPVSTITLEEFNRQRSIEGGQAMVEPAKVEETTEHLTENPSESEAALPKETPEEAISTH